MILGAGIYQVPLIRTARRMGLYTIVVSIPGDYPGFALADKIYELNTRDKEAILAAAEKEQAGGPPADKVRSDNYGESDHLLCGPSGCGQNIRFRINCKGFGPQLCSNESRRNQG